MTPLRSLQPRGASVRSLAKRRVVVVAALAAAGLCLFPQSSDAADWVVPVDAPTVAAGIDSAQAGDSVTLLAGTYFEHDLTMKEGVTLRGTTGDAEDVTIDASALGRIMTLSYLTEATHIEDITFTNGSIGESGGAIFMGSSSAIMSGCHFVNNNTYQEGGEGGAVYVFEGGPIFSECVFDYNSTYDPGSGGAVHLETSGATLLNCVFLNNSATELGGAVSIDGGSPLLSGCVLHDNVAGDGGAIAATSSTFDINGSTIAYNTATNVGGAGVALFGTSSVDIDNTIIAFGQGGGSVYTDGSGSATMTCSDVFGNVGGDYISFLSGMNGSDGNFSEDPVFCDASGRDLGLGECSPCVDAPGCEQVGALGVGCGGRRWTVPDDYETVGEALGAAAPCDTVFVLQGTYFEQSLVMKSGVTLLGETSMMGDPTTVLDGQAWQRIMTGASLDSTTVIENVRFAWGDTTGVSATGGALSLSQSDVRIRNCAFANNTADSGGAVGIYGGSPRFYECDFESNEGYDSAGAVAIMGGASVLFQDCRFYSNQSTSSAVGGAVSCYSSSNVTFQGCELSGNYCDSDGGAVYASSSEVSFLYSVLTGNSADLNGGAIRAYGSTINVDFCTIVDNTAPTGSGMHLSSSSSAVVENTIIASGSGGQAAYCTGGATASLYCCDVFDNEGGDYVGCLTGQNGSDGNISEDPLFCTGGEGSDYEVSVCSPCAGGACGGMGALGVGCGGEWWWVPDDAPTIAAAIDSASVCDTVYVMADTYYEHDIVMKNGVYLLGEDGSGGVTIDAQGLGRAFLCSGLDTTTVIDNFRIVNAETLGYGYGGAMRVFDSQLRVRNCDFVGNASYWGGAVSVEYSNTPRFENCSFELNTAEERAGAVIVSESWAEFDGCDFESNLASNAGSYGGAMTVEVGSWVTIDDCGFYGNRSDYAGGAVYADACTLVVSGSVFAGNETETEGATGGGASLSYAKASFEECTFSDNASYYGSNVFVEGEAYTPVTVDRTIVAFGTGGPGIECQGTPGLSLSCSDVYGNVGGDYVGCISGLEGSDGNFSEDPEFCRPESLDYHLRLGSPCAVVPLCGQVGALGEGCGFTIGVPGDYATIQEALDAASYGDTVVVECGTYDEGDIFLKSGVYLTSATGHADCVTLAPSAAVKNFYVSDCDASTVVRGFTLQGSQAVADPGVGMFLVGSDIVVENCDFRNLTSTVQGGGVHMEGDSAPSFTNCVFDSCSSWGNGGAVSGSSATPSFTGCSFYQNSANYDGGAVDLGDGVSATFDACTFSGNAAMSGGSAIACVSDMYRAAAVCTVSNSIIAFGTMGGATYCAGTGAVVLECCDVYGNAGGDYTGCIAGQNGSNGNISVDPLFCGEDNPAQPLALSSISPCAEYNQPVCGQMGAYGPGCAGIVSWDGGGDGTTWEDQYNWDPDIVPGATERASIDLPGTYTVTVNSDREIYGLTIGGVTADITLDIQSYTLTVHDELINYETIVVRDDAALDAPTAGRGSTIVNESGATFELNDGDITGSGLFTNRGYFTKTGVWRSHVYVDFHNEEWSGRSDDGLMEAAGGTLDVSGEFENLGRLNIITGQGTAISKHYVGRDGERAGSGTFINDGILDIDAGAFLLAGANATVSSYGTTENRGEVAVAGGATFYNESGGEFDLRDGDLNGAGEFVNRGYFAKTGPGLSTILLSFTNESAGRSDDGLVEAGAGTLDIGGEFENLGRLNIITGQGTAISKHYLGGKARAGSGTFVNSGVVDVAPGGTLTANALTTVTSSGEFDVGGLLEVASGAQFQSGGVVDVEPGGDFDALGAVSNQTGGNFVNRGRTSIPAGGQISNYGYFDHQENALLRGSGTFDTSSGLASMKGVVEPGDSPGTLSYVGDFIQTETSQVRVEIGGYAPGVDHDVLSIDGDAVFGGAIELLFAPGFTPVENDSFGVILRTGGRGGEWQRDTDFDCFAGLDVSDSLYMQPLQRPAAVRFRAVSGAIGNEAPIAADDYREVAGYSPVSVPVLDNDYDPDMDDVLVLSLLLDDTAGEAYIDSGDESVTYFALPGFAGADSFRYVVGDCVSGVDTALVRLTVEPPPRTWHVPSEAPTIQAGIDSAAVGDTVLVACGIYYESDIALKSGVTLLSETGEPDCVTIDASGRSGRVMVCEGVADVLVAGIKMRGGDSIVGGGLVYCYGSSAEFSRCDLEEGFGEVAGGAVDAERHSTVALGDCFFTGNYSISGAAVASRDSSHVSLDGCVIVSNTAKLYGGAVYCGSGSAVSITSCTLSGNAANEGAGVYVTTGAVTVSKSIISYAPYGEAVDCGPDGEASLDCADVYGNYGGDWVGCIESQQALYGNFSLDPAFCLPESLNYQLQVGSPCADAPGCGLVGALPEGCEPVSPEPEIDVAPLALELEAPVRTVVCDSLFLSNLGGADLVWRIRESLSGSREASERSGVRSAADVGRLPSDVVVNGLTLPSADAVTAANEGRLAAAGVSGPGDAPAKGERDTRTGARGAGGPDGFGYTWTDSDDPDGPVFEWFDISGVGTPVTLDDDDYEEVSLPFLFPFYGRPQEAVRISSNGYLTFGGEGAAHSHTRIPSASGPDNLVAPYWVDLDPTLGGTIHYYHDAAAGRFIVQYTDVNDYWSTGTKTFQAVLEPDGAVLFQYLDMNGELEVGAVGIEDAYGASGLQVVFNAGYLHDDLAVRIEDAAPWMTESPVGGMQEGSGSTSILVCADASGLSPGLYETDLVFESNDPGQSELVVAVTLNVHGDPQIDVEPANLAFTLLGGDSSCDTLRVANTGGDELHWSIGKDPRELSGPGAPAPARPSGLGRLSSASHVASVLSDDPDAGRQRQTVARGAGGPDAYGYTWTDSDEDGGPVFSWTDISAVGLPLMLGDDAFFAVDLPFDFPFYGGAYDTVRVTSNGYLSFVSDGSAAVNAPIPDESGPNGIAAAFWDDLDPGTAGDVHVHWLEGTGEFVIQYTGVPLAGQQASSLTFQAILRDDGTIIFQYLEMMGATDGATVGTESASGAVGLQVACNESYVHDGLAVEITPGCPWLTADPWSGVSSAGWAEAVSVCVDATELELGEHTCNLLVRSDDPDSVIVIVPVLVIAVDTGVDDGDIPREYELLGNFPNPFNPVTEIRYALPRPATVSLTVYDLSGRVVRRLLVSESQAEGRYAVLWDGRNDRGVSVSSGVYFYRLAADGDALSRKMILLK